MRLFANANYDFLSKRRLAFGVAAAFLALGLVAALIRGFNYSVEFTGGTLMQIETDSVVDVGDIRAGLAGQGITGAEIQQFGSDREFVIRAQAAGAGADPNDTEAASAAVRTALDGVIGAAGRPRRSARAWAASSAPARWWPSCSRSSWC